ncbi:MAG: FtsX-like permease family protein [Bacteroidaceae bacterium]|nr:FtsX-like permease family protein [Bacteroidaceae bacterium]
MNFPFYIARRYLISKKSHNAINWVSGISVVGVAITTMALVVTLSVFNGFHDMVATFFTTLDPDLKITPTNGKFMRADDTLLQDIRKIEGVEGVYESIEDQALLIYGQNQKVVRLRGVDDKFQQLTKIDSIIYGEGDFKLWDTQLDIEKSISELVYTQVPCATLGIGVADDLGTGVNFVLPLNVFVPDHNGQIDITDPTSGFSQATLYPSGVLFNVKQQKYDKNYIIVPIDFARDLFGQKGMISALNIKVKNVKNVKSKIESILGSKYKVSDLYEQQEDVFRIMKVEKLMAYIFLTFILIIACFNIISSLSMLIIDKKDDIVTLRSLGANDRQISNIFLFEGRLISILGAVIGICIGVLLCRLQETYGIVALGKSSGNFVVDAYPVSVHGLDIVLIFVTVVAVGFLSVCYPVHSLLKVRKRRISE